MKGLMFLFSLGLSFAVQAQNIFTEADLINVVKSFHPVARQASLEVRIADANVTTSRGAFDPVASFQRSRKEFEGINYYSRQATGLKIPTWYGIDLYAGTETLSGNRINPEETRGTLNYLGISVPVIQNLVIDKRRATLQQAKILSEETEVKRKAAVNDLVAEALLAYWHWWEQHNKLQVVKATVINAKARLEMLKTACRLGDRPAIDTLEGATLVQMLQQQETETLMMLQKSRLELSIHLWKENEVAYELPEDAVPERLQPIQPLPLDSLLAAARMQPRVLEYDYKLRGLAIEKRLQFQSLLPDVTAKYSGMTRDISKTWDAAFFNNNYQLGVAISLPLRLSEGRGAYRAARLKIEKTRLAQIAQQLIVENEVKQYYMEWQQTTVLYRQQQQLNLNYMALQRGEETRFDNGESSLFLINARASKTLEGQQKELALAAKLQQATVRLRWAAGSYSDL